MRLAAKFAMPWAAALALLRCGVAAPEECDASSAECEASSVLQTRRSSAGWGKKKKKSYTNMIAFEGNGWLAETDDAGVLVGLLNVLGKKPGSEGTLKTLFSQIDGFVSTSGGSWFMGQMAYSANFVAAMQVTAAQATSSGTNLSYVWDKKFVDGESPMPTSGQTWQEWVAEVTMQNQTGIHPDTLMGDPAQPWADGKLWVPASSLPASTTVYVQTAPSYSRDAPAFSYTPDTPSGTNGFPPYVPVGYSIELSDGKNENLEMPFTFCATADCFNLKNVYSLQTGSSKQDTTETNGPVLGDMFAQEFSQIGKLPLSGVMASSSTAGAATAVTSFEKFLQYSYVIYAAQSATQQPYQTGESLRIEMVNNFSESLANDAISAGVTLLMDGAFTSNPAIAHAWRVGATQTLSFTNVENGSLAVLDTLFGTQQDSYSDAPPGSDYSAIVFQTMKLPYANFSVADVLTGFDVNVSKTNRDLNVVYSIWYGSIKTETLGNKWVGVEDGRPITLNMVIVNSPIGIVAAQQLGSDMSDGLLFQAIVEIIADPANQKHADFILENFLEVGTSDYHGYKHYR